MGFLFFLGGFFFFSVEGVNAENGAKANLGRGFEAFASGGR